MSPSTSTTPFLLLLLTLLSLFSTVNAGVYVTNPVASTTGVGGQSLTVNWADDGISPVLSSIGTCSIDLYTGSQTQQTFLQSLGSSVDVSKTASVTSMIKSDVGPNGAYYFIRFQSATLKSTVNPLFQYQAFSARFTLSGMTGTFNSTVLAQLASATVSVTSTSAGAGTTAASATTTGGSSAATTRASSTASSSNSASAAAAATSKSAANTKVDVVGMRGLVAMGCLVGALGLGLGLIL